MGGSAPAAPDYTGAAQLQGAASTGAVNQQTQANRPTQVNAFGSSQWSMDPNGNWMQSNSLSPGLNATNQNLQMQAYANSQNGIGTGEDARNQAITGAYNQATSRLDPQWAQSNEQLNSTLANQGLDPNSQASRNAMLQQSQAKNDAYGSAMNSAIGQGTAAQQATFNENLQAQQLPYQQMGAMYGLSQPFGFNAAGQAQVPDYLQAAMAAGGYNMQQYMTDQQRDAEETSAGINAAGNVASAALGGSGGGKSSGGGGGGAGTTPGGTNYFSGYGLGPTTYT